VIYLFNCDRGSADSVAPFIRNGTVQHVQCATLQAYDTACRDMIAKTPSDDDVIVVDTLTRLLDTAIGDMKVGTDYSDGIWKKRDIYFSDKNFLNVYQAAAQLILRPLRNLNARGWRIVTICHEAEQMDPQTLTKKRGPALNDKFYQSLMGTCTDCFRLSVLRDDITNAKGDVVQAAGSRVLQTTMDDEALCKYQVEPSEEGVFRTVPKFIPGPTMRRIFKVLDKKPTWLTIYGEPGAGKTTLSVSEAFTAPKKKEEAKAV
jgi:hypothetical protein